MDQNSTTDSNNSPDLKPKKDYWGKAKQVEDEQAPLLYSKRTIYAFSALFSVLAGAILMVMNTRKLEKHDAIVPILTFAISYLALVISLVEYLESYFNKPMDNSTVFSILGGLLLTHFLWGKYIGDETQYRKRKILIPSLICSGLALAIIILMIYAAKIDSDSRVEADEYQNQNTNAVVRFLGGTIEYDSTQVSKNDAKAIGGTLNSIRYFNPENPTTAILAYKEPVFILTLQIRYDLFDNTELLNMLSMYTKDLNDQYSNLKSFKIIALTIDEKGELLAKEITSESTF